ncbi:hypothetical protein GWI33_011603 [Rhynchophorus ferrugineus]|uniref:Uncharacterized protein n=1 Tax=Rhynchophorus ferrugineus TaxID=354439 RepID=A0A834IBF5_RHYFE|nr:hypothetical protein GWI33_011603 [Rhynchophorus ferrugineus]
MTVREERKEDGREEKKNGKPKEIKSEIGEESGASETPHRKPRRDGRSCAATVVSCSPRPTKKDQLSLRDCSGAHIHRVTFQSYASSTYSDRYCTDPDEVYVADLTYLNCLFVATEI